MQKCLIQVHTHTHCDTHVLCNTRCNLFFCVHVCVENTCIYKCLISIDTHTHSDAHTHTATYTSFLFVCVGFMHPEMYNTNKYTNTLRHTHTLQHALQHISLYVCVAGRTHSQVSNPSTHTHTHAHTHTHTYTRTAPHTYTHKLCPYIQNLIGRIKSWCLVIPRNGDTLSLTYTLSLSLTHTHTHLYAVSARLQKSGVAH